MREQTSQACDACRLRKARCQTDGTHSSGPAETTESSSLDVALPVETIHAHQSPCHRCTKLGIACTYDLPVHRRGPKGPRKRKPSQDLEPAHDARDDESGESTTSDIAAPQHLVESKTDRNSYYAVGQNRNQFFQHRTGGHSKPGPDAVFTTPPANSQGSTLTEPSSHLLPNQSTFTPSTLVSPDWSNPAENCCDRVTLRQILDDYIAYIYPAIPIFHLPTFRSSFEAQRDSEDAQFFGLLNGLVALTVGLLPRKFKEYQQAPAPIRFVSRAEMIDFCYAQTIQSRTSQYFDEVSYTKWAISHVFYLAYFHVGKFNLSRMLEAECNLFARLLELHRTSGLTRLNCIETQLRKKAFWLMFYAYVHLQYSNLRKERMAFIDCSILHELDLESLLPVPHDDEYITETSYGTTDMTKPSLAQGFNWRSRLFWCGVRSIGHDWQARRAPMHCHCTRRRDLSPYLDFLHSRIRELNYMLDSAPWFLRQWSTRTGPGRRQMGLESEMDGLQMEVIRTDIHVTHLWLQSIIMDHIESYRPSQASPAPSTSALSPTTPDTAAALLSAKIEWSQREDICRQLLQVLYMAPDLSLEALGMVLVHKVRDVAVSLLSCPYDDPSAISGPATRAKAYLADFSRKLTELDMTEGLSSHVLQSWVDTGRTTNGQYDHW